ncbi:MAG: hypothetical protein IKF29_00670 [Oceanobacillus sp.]|nr:hypothetical protein [Oceanobacillus sp.]
MSKLIWDQEGKRLYETGLDHGVLYPQVSGAYPLGVAWNGLTTVDESPSGAEANAIWADNIKYLNLISNEEFACTINAYTYPDEFEACDGSKLVAGGLAHVKGQTRQKFGFSYRTLIGNDDVGTDYGYELHMIYGCNAAPSSKSRTTVNDSPEAAEMSWEISTTPVNVTTLSDDGKPIKPIAHLVLRSVDFNTDAKKAKLTALENILYGSDGTITYSEVNQTTVPTPVEGTTYYTYSGTGSPDVHSDTGFVAHDDLTEWAASTTYYTRAVAGATTARLPLPDEIFTMLSAA